MHDERSGSTKPGLGGGLGEFGFDVAEWSWLQRELTRKLLISSDTQLDLQQATRPGRKAAPGLQAAFSNDLLLHLQEDVEPFSAADAIARLARRLAKLSAEQDILKAGFTEHRRFVFQEGEAQSSSGIPDVSFVAAPRERKGAVVALGNMVLGRGWHCATQRDNAGAGYWSGPQPASTVLLPNIGAGDVRVEWTFDVVEASQASALSVEFNGRPVTGLSLAEAAPNRWRAAFAATIQPQERSSFCFLRISAGTLRPMQLKEKEPPAMVGIYVENISILPID